MELLAHADEEEEAARERVPPHGRERGEHEEKARGECRGAEDLMHVVAELALRDGPGPLVVTLPEGNEHGIGQSFIILRTQGLHGTTATGQPSDRIPHSHLEGCDLLSDDGRLPVPVIVNAPVVDPSAQIRQDVRR